MSPVTATGVDLVFGIVGTAVLLAVYVAGWVNGRRGLQAQLRGIKRNLDEVAAGRGSVTPSLRDQLYEQDRDHAIRIHVDVNQEAADLRDAISRSLRGRGGV